MENRGLQAVLSAAFAALTVYLNALIVPVLVLFAFMILAVVPAFLILRKTGILRKIEFPLTLSDWNGYSFSWKYSAAGIVAVFSRVLMVAGFLACVVAYARPVITRPEKIYTSRGSDIIFVVDVSPSMGALDIGNSTRLEASRQTITSIVTNLTGTSFGIVAMASDAVLVVPPTVDTDFFLERLRDWRWQSIILWIRMHLKRR